VLDVVENLGQQLRRCPVIVFAVEDWFQNEPQATLLIKIDILHEKLI